MKNIKKAFEITDAKIQFVSLVDRPANKKPFLIAKAENGQATFTTFGRIVKADEVNHYLTGIVYEPMVEDAHGNFMTEDEITKAAYWFVKNGRGNDVQHEFEPLEGATVVENWVAKADFKIGDEEIKKGTWLMTVELSNDDVWEAVHKGEITGFSMGGVGSYSKEDTELDNVSKKETLDENKKGLFKKFAAMFGMDVVEKATDNADKPITKAGKKISGKNKETLMGIYESFGAFLKEFDEDDNKEDENKLKADTSEENENEEKEETDVKKSEVEQIVSDAIAKALSNDIEAPNKPAPAAEITQDTVEKMVEDAIAKALKPENEPMTVESVQKMIDEQVAKAIEPVLKSRGLPTNLNGGSEVQKSDEHYLHGIL